MKRSFGTSSLPRAFQYSTFRKSGVEYFGGTGMSTFSPASSRRWRSQTCCQVRNFSRPAGLVPVGGEVRHGFLGHQRRQNLGEVGFGVARQH